MDNPMTQIIIEVKDGILYIDGKDASGLSLAIDAWVDESGFGGAEAMIALVECLASQMARNDHKIGSNYFLEFMSGLMAQFYSAIRQHAALNDLSPPNDNRKLN